VARARRRFDPRGPGWARARDILREVVTRELGPIANMGRLEWFGEGLSREVYATSVELASGEEDGFLVALPKLDAPDGIDERARQEARLLARLQTRELPFRVSAIIGTAPDGRRLAIVRRFVRGLVADLRAGRQLKEPWQVVAELAAAIHAIAGTEVADVLPGAKTRRAHALDEISVLARPELGEAHAWALAHLPPDEPSTLVHGDLLGPNILLGVDEPDAVLDWEYATCGDPAYDLAMVTRGARQPFQVTGGLDRLLEAYRAHGGRDVTVAHVRVHELCLMGRSYEDALSGETPHAPGHYLTMLDGLLRRVSADRSL